MAYIQNNPFSRKTSSPLKHNLRDKRSGESFVHYHKQNQRGEDSDIIYSSDRQIIRGNEDFGKRRNRAVRDRETNTKRLAEKRGGGRATEKNYAMDYARQIADMYNRGELTGGNFVADDFDKRSSKLSIKDGTVKIKPRFKSVGDAQRYNVTYADEAEGYDANVGYTRPEKQYTPEQIYEMMNQGGGMVSIVDGIGFVAGNPGESTRAGFDSSNIIRGTNSSKFKNQYETYEEGDEFVPFDERVSPHTEELSPQELREKMLADRKAKILASRRTEPISRKSSSPFYKRGLKSSPLNQNHDDDIRSGNERRENFDYIAQDPVVSERTEEVFDEKGNLIGYNDITDTKITNLGTREIPVTPTPPSPPTPPNWDDCYVNGVFQTGTTVGEGENAIKCEMKETDTDPDPEPIPPSPSIEEHQYDVTDQNVVFRPIDPPEIIEELDRPDRFNTSSGALKGKGLEFDLPSMSLPQLRSARKKCGDCKQRDLISRMILALGGRI
tara:strand:+ start:65 stop:1555 length:1491 start_codon:yes stop_codon:yes gene_type:complete